MGSNYRNVLLGGGTGFIGSNLKRLLNGKGYTVTVISRKPGNKRMTWDDIMRNGIPENTYAVVNLAGENVLNPFKRWTESFKKEIIDSRVKTTRLLADAIQNAKEKPKVVVSMSGVGIYEPDNLKVYDEYSDVGPGFDFISKLAHQWEEASKTSPDVRQVIIRSGVVLGRNGGLIPQIIYSFFFCMGGNIGSGKQYFPWIHIYDLCRMFVFAIENDNVTGVINGVAPNIITNKQFTKAFGKAMKRLTICPVPGFLIKLILHEDRAVMILKGQQVNPKKVIDECRFKFMYPTIEIACEEFAKLMYNPPPLKSLL